MQGGCQLTLGFPIHLAFLPLEKLYSNIGRDSTFTSIKNAQTTLSLSEALNECHVTSFSGQNKIEEFGFHSTIFCTSSSDSIECSIVPMLFSGER